MSVRSSDSLYSPSMNRPRLLRGLRITWTAICGIACILLIGLWVRSYWWIEWYGHSQWSLRNLRGELLVTIVEPDPTSFFSVAQGYGIEKLPSPDEGWDV